MGSRYALIHKLRSATAQHKFPTLACIRLANLISEHTLYLTRAKVPYTPDPNP